MCMSFYMATNNKLPVIPYNEKEPCFNSTNLTFPDKKLLAGFTLPHITEFGSDQGCGCGFRHALLDNEHWYDVINPEDTRSENNNHQQLFDFIKQNSQEQKSLEILSCWNEDFYSVNHKETISIYDILKHDFYFKEQALYNVLL